MPMLKKGKQAGKFFDMVPSQTAITNDKMEVLLPLPPDLYATRHLRLSGSAVRCFL